VPHRRRRTQVLGALLAALSLVVAACGGGSTDVPHGVDISSGSRHVNLIAFSAAKPAFDALIPLFRKDHPDIGFRQSYGASGDQSRKVARHVPADVVNFSVQPDVTRVVKAGLIDKNWETAHPNNSVPLSSVVVIVVRPGNPKGIHDWNDLLRPGIDVVTPNPASSGSAKWNLLAPYAAVSNGGKDPKKGVDFVRKLITDHTTISPSSGRDATAAFDAGQGDVLLSYESEAVMLRKQNRADGKRPAEYFIPPETFRIDLPVATVKTSDDRAAADEFLNFLFSAQAQRALPAAGFRPTDKAIAAETASAFPARIDHLWTIAELGAQLGQGTAAKNGGKDLKGWPAVDKALFSDNGAITVAYQGKKG
jgi:sulfate/thiosulfate-binding protein